MVSWQDAIQAEALGEFRYQVEPPTSEFGDFRIRSERDNKETTMANIHVGVIALLLSVALTASLRTWGTTLGAVFTIASHPWTPFSS